MSSQQNLIPLQPITTPLSSHWSIDSEDIKRVKKHLKLPTRPQPTLSLPWQKRPATYQSYDARDPILLSANLVPCTFEGFTRGMSHNTAGEDMQDASFQTYSCVQPIHKFTLPLYHRWRIELS